MGALRQGNRGGRLLRYVCTFALAMTFASGVAACGGATAQPNSPTMPVPSEPLPIAHCAVEVTLGPQGQTVTVRHQCDGDGCRSPSPRHLPGLEREVCGEEVSWERAYAPETARGEGHLLSVGDIPQPVSPASPSPAEGVSVTWQAAGVQVTPLRGNHYWVSAASPHEVAEGVWATEAWWAGASPEQRARVRQMAADFSADFSGGAMAPGVLLDVLPDSADDAGNAQEEDERSPLAYAIPPVGALVPVGDDLTPLVRTFFGSTDAAWIDGLARYRYLLWQVAHEELPAEVFEARWLAAYLAHRQAIDGEPLRNAPSAGFVLGLWFPSPGSSSEAPLSWGAGAYGYRPTEPAELASRTVLEVYNVLAARQLALVVERYHDGAAHELLQVPLVEGALTVSQTRGFFQAGDQVVQVAGQSVEVPADVAWALRHVEDRARFTVTVMRDGQRLRTWVRRPRRGDSRTIRFAIQPRVDESRR